MSLRDVLLTLNDLVSAHIIRDYAICGGYAAAYYDVPLPTYDLDVLVVLSGEDDFHNLYQFFRDRGAKIENVYIFLGDMPMTCPQW